MSLPNYVRLIRASKVPGFNRWKNPLRKTQLQATKLVQQSLRRAGL